MRFSWKKTRLVAASCNQQSEWRRELLIKTHRALQFLHFFATWAQLRIFHAQVALFSSLSAWIAADDAEQQFLSIEMLAKVSLLRRVLLSGAFTFLCQTWWERCAAPLNVCAFAICSLGWCAAQKTHIMTYIFHCDYIPELTRKLCICEIIFSF